jgi:hypothetical protein
MKRELSFKLNKFIHNIEVEKDKDNMINAVSGSLKAMFDA